MSSLLRITLLLSLLFPITACHAASPPRTAGSLIDIGGRSLHIHCIGEGSPVVVFDAGPSSAPFRSLQLAGCGARR